jgi:CrcB protein
VATLGVRGAVGASLRGGRARVQPLGHHMRIILLIAFGSALGGVARHWMTGFVAVRWGETFPWGTLGVNVLGSALIGGLAAWSDSTRLGLSTEVRQFLMVGVLGGFTTFSAFSLQTLRLIQSEDWVRASANILLSVGLSLVAVAVGYRLARLAG